MRFYRPEAKRLAKLAMRNASPHPMLVMLVYFLLTSVVSSVVSMLVSNPFNTVAEYIVDGVYDVEYIYRLFLTPQAVGLFAAVSLVLNVYNWIMGFGYTSYALRLARGEQPGFGSLLDGFRAFGRAFLVNLLVFLFTFLWGLLLLIPYFVVLILAVLMPNPVLAMSMAMLAIALAIGALVALVPITLRYRLALYFMLDNPDMGALAAIRSSKQAMRGWKAELFVLDWSFFGWLMLVAAAELAGIIVAAVIGVFVPVPALTAVLTVMLPLAAGAPLLLWLTPYMAATEANFYDMVVHGTYSYREDGGMGGSYQSYYGGPHSPNNPL